MPEIADRNIEESTEKAAPNKDAIYEENLLGDMLPVYYKRLFPHKLFHRWLSYGLSEPDIFQNREISFTMEGDIYIRSQCFENQNELEKWICTKVPQKIDIGAVMASRPRNFLTTPKAKEPVQRELVFDIDMTDYDDVRNCCSGTAICLLCWKFMIVAVRVLDAALREDFGFEHILWVFSGRRGVHCWVCDYEARHLNIRERSAVAEYLQLVTHTQLAGGLSVPRVQLGERFHHSVKRALAVVEPVFEEIIIEDQNLFGTPKGLQKLLFIIHDENARNDVEIYLKNTHHDGVHSREIWQSFTRYVQAQRNSHASSVWGRQFLLEVHINAWGLNRNYRGLDNLELVPEFYAFVNACMCKTKNDDNDCLDPQAPYNGHYDNLMFFFANMYNLIHRYYDHNKLKSYRRPF